MLMELWCAGTQAIKTLREVMLHPGIEVLTKKRKPEVALLS